MDAYQKIYSRLKNSITQYYTAKYSTETDIDKYLQTYARELASGSVEIEAVYNNLFIVSADTDGLYNNFGTYFEQGRSSYQQIDEDLYVEGSGSIPAYRKMLNFLMAAALSGGTVQALKYGVNAYTLLNPDIRELYKYSRWRLKKFSGSIADTEDNLITVSPDPGWRRDEWEGAVVTFCSGSSVGPIQDGGRFAVFYIVESNTQNTLILGEAL